MQVWKRTLELEHACSQRKPMSQKRLDGPPQKSRSDPYEGKAGAAMTRREWIQGATTIGAALALNAEPGLAATTAAAPLLVGAGKRIITPSPLLPVSGGMGPTHPTRE